MGTTKAMATATTKTTTAVAITTAAIVALNHSRSLLIRNTANNANAWTLRMGASLTPTAKGVVVRRTTKAMATATTKTTTAVASTTAAIAARNHSRSLLLRNTANNASAWIPKTEAKTMAATKTNVTRAKTNAPPKYKGDGNCDDENNNCGC